MNVKYIDTADGFTADASSYPDISEVLEVTPSPETTPTNGNFDNNNTSLPNNEPIIDNFINSNPTANPNQPTQAPISNFNQPTQAPISNPTANPTAKPTTTPIVETIPSTAYSKVQFNNKTYYLNDTQNGTLSPAIRTLDVWAYSNSTKRNEFVFSQNQLSMTGEVDLYGRTPSVGNSRQYYLKFNNALELYGNSKEITVTTYPIRLTLKELITKENKLWVKADMYPLEAGQNSAWHIANMYIDILNPEVRGSYNGNYYYTTLLESEW